MNSDVMRRATSATLLRPAIQSQCTRRRTSYWHLAKTLKNTWIPALQIAVAVVSAAIWQGIEAQQPDSLYRKRPFPERNLLPRSQHGVSDQAGLPRHAFLGDTDSMWVTCLTGLCHHLGCHPSFCPSPGSPRTASTECTGGTCRVLKQNNLL